LLPSRRSNDSEKSAEAKPYLDKMEKYNFSFDIKNFDLALNKLLIVTQ